MLIHPLGLQEFGQKVSENLAKLHFRWLKGFYEITKGTRNKLHETTPK
jgi:hypothetical protein